MRKLISLVCFGMMIGWGYFSQKNALTSLFALENKLSLTVEVEGAVKYPGTYTFDKICTVQEVLKEAIPLEEADLVSLNPVRMIYHEILVYVPYQDENHLSLNQATSQELQTIPGIGPTKAQAIIDGRPFSCLEDLMKVKGIGRKSYLKYRTYFSL